MRVVDEETHHNTSVHYLPHTLKPFHQKLKTFWSAEENSGYNKPLRFFQTHEFEGLLSF